MSRVQRISCMAAWILGAAAAAPASEEGWPNWRGPLGTGSAPDAVPPIEWSEQENLRWKVRIPGEGHSSPILWEDRIYLLTAIKTEQQVERPDEPEPEPEAEGDRGRRRGRRRAAPPTHVYSFDVLALQRKDGSVVWQKTACQAVPHEGTHGDGSFAPASAVTDGEHLFAFFGSRGVYAFDLEGNTIWQIDLGDMSTRNAFGEGSSPALYKDTLVVNWDHEGPSFLVALDKKTGKERWRVDRDEPTSWGTPLIVEQEGRTQVIVNGTTARGYDLKDGKLIWEAPGMTLNAVPTPIFAEGLVFVTTGFRGNALKAIDLNQAEGVLKDGGGIVWSADRDTPYVPSPVYHDGILYLLKSNSGILTAFNASDGEVLYGPERLEEVPNVYASLVAAGDHIYVSDRDGNTVVLEHGEELAIVAINTLDEGADASLAIVDDEIYLRGSEHLYCIAE
jgi:outer membrane protein assembly factor BamB